MRSKENALQAARTPAYRWIVLTTAFLAVFGALGFGRFGYSAVLPSMQEALGLSSAAAGSLASWNLAGYTIMAAVGGVLAARFGPRKIVTIGLVVTAAGMLFTGLSNGLTGASAGRLVTGMGNAMVFVPSISLMAAWFDLDRLGFASGIVPTGSALALIIAGPVIPRIIASGGADGWRLAWYFFAGMTIALAVVNAVVLRDRPHDASSRSGEIILDKSAPLALRTRPRNDSLDLKGILRSGYAWHLGLVYLLFGVAFMIYFTFFQRRLTADLGYSSEAAGYFFLLVGMANLFGGMIWGTVSDRLGRKHTVALTLGLSGVAAVLFGWSPATPSLVVSAVLFGATAPVLPGLIGAACADRFGTVLASASLGFVTILVGAGQTIGPYLGGLMADAFSSLGPSYLFAGVVFIAGGIAALLLRQRRKAGHQRPPTRPTLPQRSWKD